MKYYLLGVVIVFLNNLVRLLITIMNGFSQKTKNMKKIGGYFNITTGGCTRKKPSTGEVAFHCVVTLFIEPLLSWLIVCWYIFSFIKNRINKAPLPEKLKEINFKLSSIDLPKENVKECLNEISRFYSGKDLDFRIPYDDEYEKDKYSLTFYDDWNVDLYLDKSNHTFTINARDPDFGEHIDIFEYKFEGFEMWARTVESKAKYPRHIEYTITSGKVLEKEYRDRHPESWLNTAEEIEKRIQNLYSEVEWSIYHNPAIKYFALFRHGDLFDDITIKNFFQSEYERITYGYKQMEERVKNLSCYIGKREREFTNTIMCNDKNNIPEDNLIEISEILDGDGMARYGINYAEFSNYDRLVEDLKMYLSKL